MRGHVELCLRAITGFAGRFSDPMEKFWAQVDGLYRNCNISNGVPQDHIPLWWARACDARIPIAASTLKPATLDKVIEAVRHPDKAPEKESVALEGSVRYAPTAPPVAVGAKGV